MNLAESATGLGEQRAARDQAAAERRERMHCALPVAVQRLARRYGVTKVVLFGSFARGDAGLSSDLDLLVEGLPPERLFEAIATLSRELEAEVDLVPAAAARPEVLQRALAEGQVIHG